MTENFYHYKEKITSAAQTAYKCLENTVIGD